MFIAVVFFNGVMNTMGNTVLFIWLKNRPVTFEALFYGAVTGINFVSVMLWFSWLINSIRESPRDPLPIITICMLSPFFSRFDQTDYISMTL